jgi:hypothetical protein
MAHNLTKAVDDMVASIEQVSWSPVVSLEDKQKGRKPQVTIVTSSVDEEERFGDVKVTHTFTMRAYFSGNEFSPAIVQGRCREINQCLTIDRRRGGNALGTIVSEWTEQENNGRELIIMVSEPQIQLIETC